MTYPDPELRLRGSRQLTRTFCTALLAVGGVVYFQPAGHDSSAGLVLGLLVGAAGFAAARWVVPVTLRPLGPGESTGDALGRVLTTGLMGLAVSEAPATVAFVVALTTSNRAPYLVAGPIAIASIVLNATGTPALRRHVARLESRGGSTGITV